jgi:hypothetical protein
VAFVSLTDVGRERGAAFVERFEVPWPCGYGAGLGALARFGAYSTDRMSGGYNPGQEVSPTLYLIGPDGRVVWHDGQARPRHRAAPAEVIREVRAAIEAELAAGD